MSKYAIVHHGGFQYKLEPKETFEVNRLGKKAGDKVVLNDVLLIHDGKKAQVGTPHVKGASVVCEVVEHLRGDKVMAFKFRRRSNYRKRRGHRQELTSLKVSEIKVD
jgi:large subunit ribosomal protein L21